MDLNIKQILKKNISKHNGTSTNLNWNKNIIIKSSTNYNPKGHQKKIFQLKKIKCTCSQKILKIKN